MAVDIYELSIGKIAFVAASATLSQVISMQGYDLSGFQTDANVGAGALTLKANFDGKDPGDGSAVFPVRTGVGATTAFTITVAASTLYSLGQANEVRGIQQLQLSVVAPTLATQIVCGLRYIT